MTPAVEVRLRPVSDRAALETLWRDNETRLGASFFQSWTWTGCLFAERFPDPVLLEAHDTGGTLVALALFNRTRRLGLDTLHLHESGDPAKDAVYIEHNGILIAPGAPAGTLAACLACARRAPIAGRRTLPRALRLSGLGAQAALIGGTTLKTQPAPYAGLATCRDRGWLASLSANTRQQIARARRAYEADGPVAHHCAATLPEARSDLEALIALHQASWIARGRPGAFATDFVRRFHDTLLARGVPRGETSVRRLNCDGVPFAYLYDFTDPGGVRAYQSGFAYRAPAQGRARQPGLLAHALTIQTLSQTKVPEYDFLAGDAQYKRMLSTASRPMCWSLIPRWRA